MRRYYQARLSALNTELKSVKSLNYRLSFVRFILFLLFVTTLALSFSGQNKLLYIVATVLFMSLFIASAVYDMRMARRRRELERRIKFNEDEIRALNHEFAFREDGGRFATFNPHLSVDFDIFGEGSLYQYLNRSVTLRGRSRFAASLVACDLQRDRIEARAEAIKELSTKSGFVEEFVTIGSEIKEEGYEVDNLLKWVRAESSKERFINVVRFILPTITLSTLIFVALGIAPFKLLSVTFFSSLIVVYLNTKKLNAAHSLLGRSSEVLDRYSRLIKLIEREEFSSEMLQEERHKILGAQDSASRSIKRLKGILDRFDYRFNAYASVILNGVFLFDYHTYISLLRWRRDHQDALGRWFDAVTQVDSLIGLGVYACNTKGVSTYADIKDGEFRIEARDMGHPLISAESRIYNSIEISGKPTVVIITGANMAGKSTFLRTLAVNLILGMNGAPTCSGRFAFTPIKILSSIKIQDSLMNRESYFYAELLRLSEILESIKSESQSIIVLDEILRGTNTKDKQQGSIGLLRKVIEQRGVAIIATHDLVIGRMEEEYPDIVSNYCFEVEIDGDRLSFDYKLKRGISSKLNASFLMRRMGIID